MPKRTAKFVSAVFVNILAGIPLATMTRGETATVDGCLSGPKADTPPGSHWYYRIDHANKRNCWYLRSEGSGLSQTAPQNTLSASPAPSATKPSVADAHAELRARNTREDGPVSPPANAPVSAAWPASPPNETATAAVAARWPELAATNSASNGGSGTADLAGTPSQAPTGLLKEAATSALADSPAPVQPGTIPTLIAAAVGALAFAGATAALISGRSPARRPRHRKLAHARGPAWETTDDDRIVLSDHMPSVDRDYRPRFARSAGGAEVQGARIQRDRQDGIHLSYAQTVAQATSATAPVAVAVPVQTSSSRYGARA
jgi:hypothetical protein